MTFRRGSKDNIFMMNLTFSKNPCGCVHLSSSVTLLKKIILGGRLFDYRRLVHNDRLRKWSRAPERFMRPKIIYEGGRHKITASENHLKPSP